MVFGKKKKKVEEEVEEEVEDDSEEEDDSQEESVKAKNPKIKKGVWQVAEVPTQTAQVIVNKNTNEQLDVHTALAKVLNEVEKLNRALE